MKSALFINILWCATVSAFKPFFQPGVTAPLGFFDPLGLSAGKDDIEFKKFQEAEVKHGRVAMLASLGMLVQEKFHPLVEGTDIGHPIYHYQLTYDKFPILTPILLAFIGSVEFVTIQKGWTKNGLSTIADLQESYVPGDLGLDPFNLDEEQLFDMRTKELNHGRLAMLATAYLVLQGLLQTMSFDQLV